MNKILIVMLLLLIRVYALGQIDAQERFFLLCYISQGKRMGHFLRPTPTCKGNCSFEYQCKENFFTPESDTFNTLVKYWTTPIVTYSLLDSLSAYDTVHFRIYSYDDSNNTKRYHVLDLSRLYNKIPFTTEEQRLISLITILPFRCNYNYVKDTTEVILTPITGFSPPATKLYVKTLYYLLYDYVYKKRKVPIVITIQEDVGRYRHIMLQDRLEAELRKRHLIR